MIGIIYKFTIICGYKFNNQKPFYVGQHWTNETPERFKSVKSRYWGSGSIWNDFINKIKKDYHNQWRHFIKREILCILKFDDKEKLNKLEEYFIKRENANYRNNVGGCNCLDSSPSVNASFNSTTRERQSISKKKLFASKRGNDVRKKMSENHYDCNGKKNPSYGSKWITNGKESKRLFPGQEMPEGWRYGNHHVSGKNNGMYNIGTKHPCYGKKRPKEIVDKFRGKNNPMYGKISPFRGKHLSIEARTIISNKAKERFKNPKNNPMYGRHHSEKTRLLISNRAKERYKLLYSDL